MVIKIRPVCKNCDSNDRVRSTGAQSKKTYYWKCNTCKARWTGYRPFDSQADTNILSSAIHKPRLQRPRPYYCGRCGQIKKGHECTAPKSSPKKEKKETKDEADFDFLDAVGAIELLRSYPIPDSWSSNETHTNTA
jgi:hypothetical protein